MPDRLLNALLPRVAPLSARQQELAEYSNVQRMLLGVYNATNRADAIIDEYDDRWPGAGTKPSSKALT